MSRKAIYVTLAMAAMITCGVQGYVAAVNAWCSAELERISQPIPECVALAAQRNQAREPDAAIAMALDGPEPATASAAAPDAELLPVNGAYLHGTPQQAMGERIARRP